MLSSHYKRNIRLEEYITFVQQSNILPVAQDFMACFDILVVVDKTNARTPLKSP